MPYVPAICPNCGGNLSLDSTLEKGYCIHCGSMIEFKEAIQNVIFNQPLEFGEYKNFATLLDLIEEDLQNGTNQTPEFRSNLVKALELAPDNEYLYGLVESEIWHAKIANKTLLEYTGTAQKIVVPNGIETIDKLAFARHINLKEITLPRDLKLIRQGAFIYEDRMTINAYNESYGAKYAMSSPAKLNLIDKVDKSDKYYENIEEILRELTSYKKHTFSTIERFFNKRYSIKWGLVLLVLCPAFLAIYINFDSGYLYNGLAILSVFYIFGIIGGLIIKTGYDEIKCKTAIKRQSQFFMRKCNGILNPLGIVDFIYIRNIFEDPYIDLKEEFTKLVKSRDMILNLNLSDIYKRPKLYYPITDYLAGKKPYDYDK